MKTRGKISVWHDDKGYGFITSAGVDKRVFVHIKAFADRGRRPAVGDRVHFRIGSDARGRPRAEAVSIDGNQASRSARAAGGMLTHAVALGFLLIVVIAGLLSLIPLPLAMFYLLVSAVTFATYALDKSAAKRGARRTPENTLHLLSLAGGWPGALIAQRRLRHKSRKQPFRTLFWITMLLNCAALAWLSTPQGAGMLDQLIVRGA